MSSLRRARNLLLDPSILARYLAQRRKMLGLRYEQRRNRGVFSVNFRRSSGFFAQLTWCAYVFSYCHDRGLVPHVTAENPNYTDPKRGPDFVSYFFDNREQRIVDANLVVTSTVERVQELGLPTDCIAGLTLERAAMLMQRYLRLRPEIAEDVERFAHTHFAGRRVLGVHFRGTDKTKEAPRVSRDKCSAEIRRFLVDHPQTDLIFATSDEASFVPFLQSEISSVPVCFRDDWRSEDGVAVHRASFAGSNYEKGRQALLSSLLLSRCDAVIRTASSLSGWASVFRPRLPVTMLNRPYPQNLWFPDRCVVERATMADGGSDER